MVKLFPFWWLVPPAEVELVEGDYTTWTKLWLATAPDYLFPFYYNESADILWLRAQYEGKLYRVVLSTGADLTTFGDNSDQTIEGEIKFQSILGKYFAYVESDGGGPPAKPLLKIYKDGVLIQTIDLKAICNWDWETTYSFVVGFTSDGKYLLVYNNRPIPAEMALFKGS